MAAWRDKLRPASFRNVPFLVRAIEGTHGRRLASHEYPLRDDPWHEDLGRLAKRYQFDGYVVEPDHIDRALALIAACEKDGPGKLIHPWIGEVDVVLTECKVRFSHEEGGMATFALAFAEAGKPVYPIAEKNAEAVVDKVAKEAKEKASSRFLKGFSVDKVASWVSGHISSVLQEGIGAIEQALGAPGGFANIAAWSHDLAGVVQTASSIIRNPAGLATRILGLIDLGNANGIKELVQFPLSVANLFQAVTGGQYASSWRAYVPLAEYGLAYGFFAPTTSSGAPAPMTASRIKDNASVAALHSFIRSTAIAEMARAAVRQELVTQQEGAAALAAIQAAVDREVATTGDEDGEALQTVARTTALVLARKIETLPRLVTITPATTAPLLSGSGTVPPKLFGVVPHQTVAAIVIAHAVYGDRIRDVEARAEQIVARNRIPHPGFIPGGDPLELISTW